MKRLSAIILSLLLVTLTALSVCAATLPDAPVGDKVVFKDADWAYEKVNTYGWEIDEYIGSSAEPSVPYSFAKEYVTTIGSRAFSGNTAVTSVTLTPVITGIGEYAFNGCTSLERVELYDSTTLIDIGCFYGTTALTDINLQDTSITEVSAYCFADSGITQAELPETCESIGNMAFYHCTSLSKLVIPRSVTQIADSAFTSCDDLTVHCYKDSYAHQYVEEKGIPYVLLDQEKPTEYPTEPVVYILGDADGNWEVETIDATWIQRYNALMEYPMSYEMLLQGDVDGDGEIAVIDATYILRYTIYMDTPYAIGEYLIK